MNDRPESTFTPSSLKPGDSFVSALGIRRTSHTQEYRVSLAVRNESYGEERFSDILSANRAEPTR